MLRLAEMLMQTMQAGIAMQAGQFVLIRDKTFLNLIITIKPNNYAKN
jgi:hypothetical protein